MTISVGDTLPDGTLSFLGKEGPETVSIADISKGKKIVLFGLPGAYTGTCSTLHMPSFIRTAADFRAKGYDGIYCVTVNDVFVAQSWDKDMGASDAGVTVLADLDASFTKAAGMEFSAPPVGLFDRSRRYSALVEDGKITVLHIDEPGVCEMTAGENLLQEA